MRSKFKPTATSFLGRTAAVLRPNNAKDKLVRVLKPRLCNRDEAGCLFMGGWLGCLRARVQQEAYGRLTGVPAGKSATGYLYIVTDLTNQLNAHSKMYLQHTDVFHCRTCSVPLALCSGRTNVICGKQRQCIFSQTGVMLKPCQ